jgi:quercetin dioxygenase-like cupin family protein
MPAVVIKPGDLPVHDRGGGVRTRYLVTREVGAHEFLSGLTEFDPGASLALHSHNCEESVVVMDGIASFEIDGRSTEMRPGDATWVPAGSIHRFANRTDASVTILWTYGSVEATRVLADTGETIPVNPVSRPS